MSEPDKEVKTKFKGPGQWRSQAAELEGDDEPVEEETET